MSQNKKQLDNKAKYHAIYPDLQILFKFLINKPITKNSYSHNYNLSQTMEKLSTTIPIDMFLIIFLSVVLIIAAIIDMRTYRIPNLLTYPAMLIALIYHTVTSGVSGLSFSLLGLLVGIGLFSIPFFMGVMGAGDAKLMGAVGAALGSRGVLNASLFTAVAGGVFSLILLLSHYRDFRFVTRAVETIQASLATKCFIRIPVAENKEKPRLYYGIAIASGTLYTMWWKVSHTGFPL